MRITTRLAHSRAAVNVKTTKPEIARKPVADEPASWVLLPANAKRKNNALTAKQSYLEKLSGETSFSRQLWPNRVMALESLPAVRDTTM